MPMMNEAIQVGKVQELGAWISNIQPDQRPFLSAISQGGRPNQSTMQAQAEVYDDFGFDGSLDGVAITDFNAQNREMIYAGVQQFDHGWSVSERAMLTNTAGVGASESSRQAVIAQLQLGRKKERAYCSNFVARRESGQNPWRTWGIFGAMDPTLSLTGEFALPAAIAPVAAQQSTVAIASLTEAILDAMFQACFLQKKAPIELTGFVGIRLKAWFDALTMTFKEASTSAQPRTIFKVEGNDIFEKKVSRYTTSNGTLTMIPTVYLLNDPVTGGYTDYSARSGAFLDLAMWKDRQLLPFSPRRLADKGQGDQGYNRTLAGLQPVNTQGQFTIVTNADS